MGLHFSPTALRAERERAGLSCRALAIKAGLNPNTVNDIESGKHEPGANKVAALACALECDLDDLYAEGNGTAA